MVKEGSDRLGALFDTSTDDCGTLATFEVVYTDCLFVTVVGNCSGGTVWILAMNDINWSFLCDEAMEQ